MACKSFTGRCPLLPSFVLPIDLHYSVNDMLLLNLTVAAVADTTNPCAISVYFLTVGFLFSLNKDRNHILKIGLVYVKAIYVVYVSIGLGILASTHFV